MANVCVENWWMMIDTNMRRRCENNTYYFESHVKLNKTRFMPSEWTEYLRVLLRVAGRGHWIRNNFVVAMWRAIDDWLVRDKCAFIINSTWNMLVKCQTYCHIAVAVERLFNGNDLCLESVSNFVQHLCCDTVVLYIIYGISKWVHCTCICVECDNSNEDWLIDRSISPTASNSFIYWFSSSTHSFPPVHVWHFPRLRHLPVI